MVAVQYHICSLIPPVRVVVFTTFFLVHDLQALNFIKQLGEAMHSVNSGPNPSQHLQLILVISPVQSDKLSSYDFGPEDMKLLTDSVDGFSLMTYDFSGPQKPGPNAPLEWIKYCLGVLLGDEGTGHAHMIFLGINFYGNDFVIAEGEIMCLDLDLSTSVISIKWKLNNFPYKFSLTCPGKLEIDIYAFVKQQISFKCCKYGLYHHLLILQSTKKEEKSCTFLPHLHIWEDGVIFNFIVMLFQCFGCAIGILFNLQENMIFWHLLDKLNNAHMVVKQW